ncbi:uncharacterized protein LOC123555613 [Mercenaria mercenaria]|uniref:uncharacterized protein LOC123555613 n=1 Tax=Mercenaria mercenaria TaxID=6596 RepID=UPI00234F2433|nr:uncharacterized protein LOC123555613 [Mercenaria mercenaria]
MTQTNYMCMNYYCFPTSDVLEFCDTSGAQVATSPSYFYNDGYPSGISHSNCCACVITASAASATIDLDILDLQLYDATATCLQTVFVTDSLTVTSYNCTENNDYTIKNFLTSSGSSLTVTLKSDASAVGNGKAWFRATVSNGGMTTSCSSVTQCPDETATATSANAGSGDASSNSATEETWLFGLSVTLSAIVLAALFLFILLTCLICCAICYKWGKSKSFDVTQVRSESRQHLHTDRPKGSPDSLPTYTHSVGGKTVNTRILSVGTSDLDFYSHRHSVGPPSEISTRTGMFLYRPFENRYHLRSYFRRPSLVRVESP